MKTAIVLSGQLRNFDECFPSFKANILDHNDCHIYMHTYIDTDMAQLQKAIALYQPQRLLLERQEQDFQVCPKCVHPTPPTRSKREAMYWMFRNVQVAFKTIPADRYDCIVKARYDLQYTKPIVFFDYDMNNINVPDGSDFLGGLGDLFAFSCYAHMEYYFTMYEKIEQYVMVDGVNCHPETLLRYHLRDKPLFRPDFPLYLRDICMTDYKG